jgi:muramoyltetrapeptide carboxypeptidase LdcA involved in peptidoglycan recycling
MISFSGPHWSTFGMEQGLEYTIDWFIKVLVDSKPNEWFDVQPSKEWRDDAWFIDQTPKNVFKNQGYQVIQKGIANGTIIGGNIDVLNLLRGTPYFPIVEDPILFLEGTGDVQYEHFDQLVQALLYIPKFKESLRAIVIGRFQIGSKMTVQDLQHIFETKRLDIPIVYGLDFGHSTPHLTIPIGGQCRLDTTSISISW